MLFKLQAALLAVVASSTITSAVPLGFEPILIRCENGSPKTDYRGENLSTVGGDTSPCCPADHYAYRCPQYVEKFHVDNDKKWAPKNNCCPNGSRCMCPLIIGPGMLDAGIVRSGPVVVKRDPHKYHEVPESYERTIFPRLD